MITHDLFEFQRSVAVRGALGPLIFVEQHDYTYGGGAHGGIAASLRVIDVERATAIEGVEALFTPDELAKLKTAHGPVVAEIFRRFRSDPLLDSPEPELVSARPRFTFARGSFEFMLTFTAASSYAGSDHRWSSYSIAEEVLSRALPIRFEPFRAIPELLVSAIGSAVDLCVGWSRMTPSHPAHATILDRALVSHAR